MPPRGRFTIDKWHPVGDGGTMKERLIRPTAGHDLNQGDYHRAWALISKTIPANWEMTAFAMTANGAKHTNQWVRNTPHARALEWMNYEGEYSFVGFRGHPGVDDDYIKEVHIWVRPPAAGGASELNDCLFECIFAYFTRYNRPMPGPLCASGLKQYLGLLRDAPVPVDLMPKVEEAYSTKCGKGCEKDCKTHCSLRITVEGEAKYGEVPDRKRGYLRLALRQGHYYNPEKKPATLILWKRKGNDKALVITSDSKGKVVEKDWSWLSERLRLKGDYACLKAGPLGGNRGHTLECQWKTWGEECAALSPYGVDLHMTPTYGAAARRELALTAKMLDWKYLPVDQQRWIQLAHPGGHVWQKPGFEGKATRSDYNSHHPSLLAKCTFPKAPGIWRTLKGKIEAKDGSKNWNLGIYRLASPLPAQDPGKCPLWIEKKTPYYTHYDLRSYEEATGKVAELAQDGKPNALLWPARTHTADGRVVFKALVDKWYVLKQKKVPGAGNLLKAMCGALSSRSKKWAHVKANDKLPTRNVLYGTRRADGTHDIEYQPGADIYSGAAPAVNCFVAAQGRYELCAQLRGLKDVVSVLTDSFTVQTPLAANDRRLGAGLGQLKSDKTGTYKVTGMCTGVWN